MKNKIYQAVPTPTLRRLPIYLRLVQQRLNQGATTISCSDLAEVLSQDPTQIRKDLSLAGINGRPRIGFDAQELIDTVEKFLGWKKTSEAFLVGVGNLGRALLGYNGFNEHGLKIVAAFDKNPAIIGTEVNDCRVLHVDSLGSIIKRMHIVILVLTTPAAVAQQIADEAVKNGVEAIWNFAPTHLQLPEHVVVENTQLSSSLAVLSGKLAQKWQNIN